MRESGAARSLGQRGGAMITAGLVFAALAALLHVYIFVMESLTWTSPRTRATFGTTEAEAETTKLLAFNQGFYNLFLAVVTGIGIIEFVLGHKGIGAALVFAGVGSMAAAAVVLVASDRDKARAAATQGTFPAIAIVLLLLGLH
jgi:putative membrane protein